MSGRWSKQRAAERCAPLSTFMWQSLPVGLAVLTIVNVAQLLGGWSSYRHGSVAVLLLASLVSMFMLIWYQSPKGVGPVLSGLAVLTGPAACLIIATQLNPTALTGPANWVSGFCIVPILLLPFSRPPEEMVLGVAAIIAAQAAVMWNAGRTLRDLHTIVMSGGAGAAIGVSTLFLVAVIRQLDTMRREQAEHALEAIRFGIYRQDASVSLRLRVTAAEAAAARMLDALATGAADLTDPHVQRACVQLTADLRRELQNLTQPSLLLAAILPDDGELRWSVDDDQNVIQHLRFDDRRIIINALRSILALMPVDVSISIVPLRRNNCAKIIIICNDAAFPDTPEWQITRERFNIQNAPNPGNGERVIYSWDLSVDANFWRNND